MLEVRMKNQNGITMVTLVVTIILLLLLSGITVTVSLQSFHMANVQAYVSKMKVIQGKVDNLVQENADLDSQGFQKLSELSVTEHAKYEAFLQMLSNPSAYDIDVTKSWDNTLDADVNQYYFFSAKDLEKLGLKNQDMDVIVNFQTRNIISRKGIAYQGKTYYRQYDINLGQKLID